MNPPATSVPIAQHGDWAGVFGQYTFFCALTGGSCVDRFSCAGEEEECVLAPEWLLENFRSRYPEVVAASKKCPLSASERRLGVPDVVMWRTRGSKAIRMVEVKFAKPGVAPKFETEQLDCLRKLSGKKPVMLYSYTPTIQPRDVPDIVQMYEGTGRTRLAAVDGLAFHQIKQRTKNKILTAAAAKESKRKRGPHIGGLREAMIAYRPSEGRWYARLEVAVLLGLITDPVPLPPVSTMVVSPP